MGPNQKDGQSTNSLKAWNATNKLPIPSGMEYWQAHSVAECLSYDKFLPESYGKLYENLLCVKLWNIQANAEQAQKATPMGGDGSEGTYEDPSEIESGTYDDEARHWWSQLLPLEQRALVLAYDEHKKEYQSNS